MKLNQCIPFILFFICQIKASDKKYFSEFKYYDTSSLEFSREVMVNGDSDTVLVKCPSNNYNHFDKTDIFEPDNSTDKLYVAKVVDDKLQYIIHKNELPYKNHTEFNCGKLAVNLLNNVTEFLDWKYKLNWQMKDELMKVIKYKSIGSNFMESCDECRSYLSQNYSNYIIKFSDGKSVLLEEGKKYDFHKNDILYYFTISEHEWSTIVTQPCCTRKLIDGVPTITLAIKPNKNNLIELIDIYEMSYPIQRFIVHYLDNNRQTSKDYAYKATYSMVEMKYQKNELVEIIGTENEIIGEVFVDEFKLIKFSFECIDCREYVTGTKFVFLSPPKDKRLVSLPEIRYELFVKPNCSMNAFNFAYLESISFEDQSITVDELLSKLETGNENFVIEDYSVFYTVKAPTGLLTCTYITPDGKYTTEIKFTNPSLPTKTKKPKYEEENKNDLLPTKIIMSNDKEEDKNPPQPITTEKPKDKKEVKNPSQPITTEKPKDKKEDKNPPQPITTVKPKDKKQDKKKDKKGEKKGEKKGSLNGGWIAVIIILCLVSVCGIVCFGIYLKKILSEKRMKEASNGKEINKKCDKKIDNKSSDKSGKRFENSNLKSKEISKETSKEISKNKSNEKSIEI